MTIQALLTSKLRGNFVWPSQNVWTLSKAFRSIPNSPGWWSKFMTMYWDYWALALRLFITTASKWKVAWFQMHMFRLMQFLDAALAIAYVHDRKSTSYYNSKFKVRYYIHTYEEKNISITVILIPWFSKVTIYSIIS